MIDSVRLKRLSLGSLFRILTLQQYGADFKSKMSKEMKHDPRGPTKMPCFPEHVIKIQDTRLRGVKASKTAKNGEILLQLTLSGV